MNVFHVFQTNDQCYRTICEKLGALAKDTNFMELADAMKTLVQKAAKSGISLQWFSDQLKFLQDTVKKLWKNKWIQIGIFVLLVAMLVGLCLFFKNGVILKIICQGAKWLASFLMKMAPQMIACAFDILAVIMMDFIPCDDVSTV